MKKLFFLIVSIIVLSTAGIILILVHYSYLSSETGLGVLGYCGSIIGGFLTLLGVWWTINERKQERKSDIALQYRPILSYDFTTLDKIKHSLCGEINLIFKNERFNNADFEWIKEVVMFENIGRGEMVQAQFEMLPVTVTFFNSIKEDVLTDETSADILGKEYIHFVPINGKIYFQIGIPRLYKEFKERYDNRLLMALNISVKIRYTDFYNINEYTSIFNFNLGIDLIKGIYKCDIFNSSLNLEQK
jgi:hypothetical protein